MHVEALPQSTHSLLRVFMGKPQILQGFYLTGGTALSLHLGHRESDDLDFFSKQSFDPQRLEHELRGLGKLTNVERAQGTFNLFLGDVELQFLHYPYRLLRKPLRFRGIAISSLVDIACTKLLTISSRGSKKDFIDIFVLLEHYTLPALFRYLKKKYTGTDYSQIGILKSLVYFDDAEGQPMPRLHIPLDWEEVKKKLIKAVKAFRL